MIDSLMPFLDMKEKGMGGWEKGRQREVVLCLEQAK